MSERRRPSDVWAAAAGGVVFAGCAWLAAGDVDGWERRAFAHLNRQPTLVRSRANVPRYVEPALPALAGLALSARRRHLAAAALLAVPIEKMLERGAQGFARRRRPAEGHDASKLRAAAPTSGVSFPSSHACVTVTVVVLLRPYVPAVATGIGAVATAVACVFRVYQGAHYPLDAIGGAGLGVLVGSVMNRLFAPESVDASGRRSAG